MSYQHKNLAAGGWSQVPFMEQMANIGSELERALNWQVKHNTEYSQKSFERAIELMDLTLSSLKTFSRLKEVARLREAITDYFLGENQFKLTDESIRKYFSSFIYAARKNH